MKTICKIILPLALLLFSSLIPSSARAWTGKVIRVSDGDTISVLHNGQGERIRLYGIDCPEKRQAFGKRAKQFTSSMVFGKRVKVDYVARDRYGRTVAIVKVGNTTLNQELLESGLAWVYTRYCHKSLCLRWNNIEKEARASMRGLWSDPGAIAPWKYRHSRKRKTVEAKRSPKLLVVSSGEKGK